MTTASVPRSPAPCSSTTSPKSPSARLDNDEDVKPPSYLGIFADPDSATRVSPQEALSELDQVARVVAEAAGIPRGNSVSSPTSITSAKKRIGESLFKFVPQSLSLRAKGHRTQSCSESSTRSRADGPLQRCSSTDSYHSSSSPRVQAVENQYYNFEKVPCGSPERFTKIGNSPSTMRNISRTLPAGPTRSASFGASGIHSLPRSSSVKTSHASAKYVLHNTCRKSDLRDSYDAVDVVLVFSDQCSVSRDWCRFLREMLQANDKDGQAERIHCQSVEHFSEQLTAAQNIGSSSPMLTCAEERTFHARAQIVIVSPDFLHWVGRRKESGPLLYKVLRPTRLLGLLLGVRQHDIRAEHMVSLSTFKTWKTMDVVSNSSTFAPEVFRLTFNILASIPKEDRSGSSLPQSPSQRPDSLPKNESHQNYINCEEAKNHSRHGEVVRVLFSSQDCTSILILFITCPSETRVYLYATDDREENSKRCEVSQRRWLNNLALECQLPNDILSWCSNSDGTAAQVLNVQVISQSGPMQTFELPLNNAQKAKSGAVSSETNKRKKSDPYIPMLPLKTKQKSRNSENRLKSLAIAPSNRHGLRRSHSTLSLSKPGDAFSTGTTSGPSTEFRRASSIENADYQVPPSALTRGATPFSQPGDSFSTATGTVPISTEFRRAYSVGNADYQVPPSVLNRGCTQDKPVSRQELLDAIEKKDDTYPDSGESRLFPCSSTCVDLRLWEGATSCAVLGPGSDPSMVSSSSFEKCQAELIDLQKKYKENQMSLLEVEAAFENWKQKPQVCDLQSSRKAEIESLRNEWNRLQKAAPPKDPNVTKRGLLRSLTFRRKKSVTESPQRRGGLHSQSHNFLREPQNTVRRSYRLVAGANSLPSVTSERKD